MTTCDCNCAWNWQSLCVRVKTGLRQIITVYVVACLVLAAMAGVSPSLHVLLEHGGLGAAHVHGRKANRLPAHAHANVPAEAHAQGHPHTHSSALPAKNSLFVHEVGAFPSVDELAVLIWNRVHAWLEHSNPAPVPPDPASEHRHDSLTSLMSEGAIEHAAPASLCVAMSGGFCYRLPALVTRTVAIDWDPQSSPRAPPVSPG